MVDDFFHFILHFSFYHTFPFQSVWKYWKLYMRKSWNYFFWLGTEVLLYVHFTNGTLISSPKILPVLSQKYAMSPFRYFWESQNTTLALLQINPPPHPNDVDLLTGRRVEQLLLSSRAASKLPSGFKSSFSLLLLLLLMLFLLSPFIPTISISSPGSGSTWY